MLRVGVVAAALAASGCRSASEKREIERSLPEAKAELQRQDQIAKQQKAELERQESEAKKRRPQECVCAAVPKELLLPPGGAQRKQTLNPCKCN
jgi:hypothetical protein